MSAHAPEGVEWIAHRGESADAPENTLSAFRLAWERGVLSVELDVRLTIDGELAVCHDAGTVRTTGVPRLVAQSTMEELRRLDAGAWRGPRWAGEPLPSLRDVLEATPRDARLWIEVKGGPEAGPSLVRALDGSGLPPASFVVIGFDMDTVADARRRVPAVPAYLLSGFQRDAAGAWRPSAEELIERAVSIGATGLDLSATGPLDEGFVRQARAAGLDVAAWTVDDAATARRLLEAGVRRITSNRAAALRAEITAH
ncbi:MAG TPA: glycerophosphodiester phosphodiesterase family protein [Chthonomonadales bacterium]|nr:glycerophosphodiester phosphodiesterase family protein [Chthonomonadales bacterium]